MGSENSKESKGNGRNPKISTPCSLLALYPLFTYDEKHEKRINCISVSPNNDYILTGGEDSFVRIWELTARKCVGTLEGHQSYITCIIALEEYVVSGSGDYTAKKWNFNDGQLLLSFEGHTCMINKIEVHDNMLFSSSFDKTTRIYNFTTGECLYTLAEHTKLISSLISLPESEILLTGSGDGTVRAWKFTTWETVLTFTANSKPILCVQVDLDKRLLYTGGDDDIVRQWDLDTAAPKARFIGHSAAVLCLCLHGTKSVLFSGSSDKSIRKWSTHSKKGRMSTGNLNQGSIGTIIMHGLSEINGEFIFAGTTSGAILCIDVNRMSLIGIYQPQSKSVPRFLILKDILYTGNYNGEVQAWKADLTTILGVRK